MSGLRWKVCGITNPEDAALAVAAGADAIGFVFWPRSPRGVSAEQAAGVSRELPEGVLKFGVFVDAAEAELREAADAAALDFVQMHGDESPEACAATPRPAWKALRLAAGTSVADATAQAAPYAGLPLVVDAGVAGEYGGTGEITDWDAAAALALEHKVLLAGGLKADNVGAAVEKVRPWGVDVSSGVEACPGIKDADKLNAFARALEHYR